MEWLRRGEGRDPVRPPTPAYANFAAAITHAKAADEVRRIARIDAAAQGGATIHEKTTTYPDGRTIVERQVTPPIGEPMRSIWNGAIATGGANASRPICRCKSANTSKMSPARSA
jgi:hypothetical protein